MPKEVLDIERSLVEFFGRSPAPAPGVVAVYLFGSHAARRAHRHSDVDIGILLDWTVHSARRERFEQRVHLSGQLAQVVGSNDVDIVILNHAPPQLARAIVTIGRRIFCNDQHTDHAFLRTTLLRAADLEPFLRRTCCVKLAAIAR